MPEQYLYLTTTGHKTGNPHEIEIWFVALDGRYYLVSERCEAAHWVQNIQNSPAVTFYLGKGGTPAPATARLIHRDSEPTLAAKVSALMHSKYGWSDGLIVEISPGSPAP